MFGKKQKWIYADGKIIALDHVCYFEEAYFNGDLQVNVHFNNDSVSILHGCELRDIGYFLKHGKPRKSGKP